MPQTVPAIDHSPECIFLMELSWGVLSLCTQTICSSQLTAFHWWEKEVLNNFFLSPAVRITELALQRLARIKLGGLSAPAMFIFGQFKF